MFTSKRPGSGANAPGPDTGKRGGKPMSTDQPNKRDAILARMTALASQQPTRQLCEALTILEAKTEPLSEPERMTRAVLIDVITARHPEADKAFDEWANGPTWQTAPAVEAITTAALAAAAGGAR